MSSSYSDLEIRIGAATPNGYPVRFIHNVTRTFSGFVSAEALTTAQATRFSLRGTALFSALTADRALSEGWNQILGDSERRRIRLNLDPSDPFLHSISWELLATPDSSLAASKATPFSRFVECPKDPPSPFVDRPIRILVAVSNPTNLADFSDDLVAIPPEEQHKLIEDAIGGQDNIEIHHLNGPCTLKALNDQLKPGYHILYLVAHGEFKSATSTAPASANLYLQNEEGFVDLVSANRITRILANERFSQSAGSGQGLQLVYLSCCESARASEQLPASDSTDQAFLGLAPMLIAAGVPGVLAMGKKVPVDAANKFAAAFFKDLKDHGDLSLAANNARSSLFAGVEALSAAIPIIFLRQFRSDEVIAEVTRKSRLPRWLIALAAALTLLAVFAGWNWFKQNKLATAVTRAQSATNLISSNSNPHLAALLALHAYAVNPNSTNEALLFNIAPRLIPSINTNGDQPNTLKFLAARDNTIAAAGDSSSLLFGSLQSLTPRTSYLPADSRVIGLALDEQLKPLLATSRGFATPSPIAPSGQFTAFAANSTGSLWALAGADNTIAVKGFNDPIKSHDQTIRALAFTSGSSPRLISGDANGDVVITRLAAKPIFERKPSLPESSGAVIALATSPGGPLFFAGTAMGKICLLQIEPSDPYCLFHDEGFALESLALSPSGKTLISIGNGRVKLWNVTSNTFALRLEFPCAHFGSPCNCYAVPFDSKTDTFLFSGPLDSVRVFDPEITRLIPQLRDAVSKFKFKVEDCKQELGEPTCKLP